MPIFENTSIKKVLTTNPDNLPILHIVNLTYTISPLNGTKFPYFTEAQGLIISNTDYKKE
jgi:hypothetical protein